MQRCHIQINHPRNKCTYDSAMSLLKHGFTSEHQNSICPFNTRTLHTCVLVMRRLRHQVDWLPISIIFKSRFKISDKVWLQSELRCKFCSGVAIKLQAEPSTNQIYGLYADSISLSISWTRCTKQSGRYSFQVIILQTAETPHKTTVLFNIWWYDIYIYLYLMADG